MIEPLTGVFKMITKGLHANHCYQYSLCDCRNLDRGGAEQCTADASHSPEAENSVLADTGSAEGGGHRQVCVGGRTQRSSTA